MTPSRPNIITHNEAVTGPVRRQIVPRNAKTSRLNLMRQLTFRSPVPVSYSFYADVKLDLSH
jgi:hypothetical protein